MSHPKDGNLITESLMDDTKRLMDVYLNNPVIQVLFFTSSDSEFFSDGLESKQFADKARRQRGVAAANEMSRVWTASDKTTIAVYGGDVESSGFGIFAGSDYRLGTASTRFRIADMLPEGGGQLPVGGGLAHYLAATSDKGYAVSKVKGR